MLITVEQLKKISKNPNQAKPSLLKSVADAVNKYGAREGLDQPHRLAQYLAQLAHECTGFVHDREIWGPTPAQKRYEGRADLGNTQRGDGSKFRGYGPIQVTGRNNATAFYNWCKKNGYNPPNFVEHPELIATEQWAGLSAIWYWSVGNPTGKSLNVYADANNIEMVTRKINGGLNGYTDRLDYYDRAALVLLGYGPKEVRLFQTGGTYKGEIDGETGPKTRAALHTDLLNKVSKSNHSADVAIAPVVETKTVAVVAPEKPWYKSKEVIAPMITGGGLTGGATLMQSFGSVPWQNLLVLIGAAFVGLMIYLIWSNRQERKKVEETAKALQ